jgi:hypothetical protein
MYAPAFHRRAPCPAGARVILKTASEDMKEAFRPGVILAVSPFKPDAAKVKYGYMRRRGKM